MVIGCVKENESNNAVKIMDTRSPTIKIVSFQSVKRFLDGNQVSIDNTAQDTLITTHDDVTNYDHCVTHVPTTDRVVRSQTRQLLILT